MTRKAVNNNSLALAIEQKRLEADDRQILTRSQQELELAMLAVTDLQKERKALEGEVNGVASNIINLNMLHTKLSTQIKDIDTLLKAKLDTVNSLQQAGVSIQ
jgi:hypothetical protein